MQKPAASVTICPSDAAANAKAHLMIGERTTGATRCQMPMECKDGKVLPKAGACPGPEVGDGSNECPLSFFNCAQEQANSPNLDYCAVLSHAPPINPPCFL